MKKYVFGGLMGLAFVSSWGYLAKQMFLDHPAREESIRSNISSKGVYLENRRLNPFGKTSRDFPVGAFNEDVNGDGIYESVLAFKNPLKNYIVEREYLIEREGNEIRLRRFHVVGGEIVYLND